jgi:hypothetical protein
VREEEIIYMLPEASHPKAGQISLSRTGWSSRTDWSGGTDWSSVPLTVRHNLTKFRIITNSIYL